MKVLGPAELVRRCLGGEEAAFRELVTRNAAGVYRRVIGKVRNPDDAEDLVQEVFAAAFIKLADLKDAANLRPWLHRIADNQALMHLRRRPKQLSLEDLWGPATTGSECAAQDGRGQREVVREALRRLSAAHRVVIAYHYFRGYSYKETADLLSLTPDRVRSRLQKARIRLGKELSTMGNEARAPQRIELGLEEIGALDWAMRFASDDEKRPVLRGVFIDTGGRIVSCDGHRLMVWPSPRLAEIPAPILFGPVDGARMGPGQATLELEAQEVRVVRPDQPVVAFAIVERPYVKYESVIPKTHAFRVAVDFEALREMVDRIAPCLRPMHPADGEPWQYTPKVELRVSREIGLLTLTTTSGMGYFRLDEAGKHHELPAGPDRAHDEPGPTRDRTDWSFTASAKVRVGGSLDEVFRIGVNHDYLKDAVDALGARPGSRVEIGLEGPLKPIVLRLTGVEGRLSLVMPLRLAPDPKESGEQTQKQPQF